MTKFSQLFALTLGLASFTAPVFAHDVDACTSASDRGIAHRANVRMSAYDLNRDGRVTPYEVKRVKQEQERHRELMRRQEAALHAREHEQALARARVAARADHHYAAPAAYRR